MMRRATVGVLRRFGPGVLRTAMLAAVASAALLLLAACGEGQEEEAAPAAAAATEEAREEAATAAPGETETAAGEKLYGLERFHYRLEHDLMGSVMVSEGDYVAPDRHAWSVSFHFGDLSMEEDIVVIGDRAWYRDRADPLGRDWREDLVYHPRVQRLVQYSTMDPGFFLDLEDFEGLRGEDETLDGLEVRHYQVSKELEGIEQFSMEFWLASDGGWPVRIIREGSATPEALGMETPAELEGILVHFSTRLDVTQVNDPSVTIEPPV